MLIPVGNSCSNCSSPSGPRRSRRPSTTASRAEAILRPATKQLAFKTLPLVLKFQLKRFHWAGRDRAKISRHVLFSFELNMGSYLSSSSSSASTVMYDLVAVIVHEGSSMSGGHYKCYAYNPAIGSWIVKNDARVSCVDQQEILGLEAYLLLYVHRKATSNARQDLLSMPSTPVH